MPRMSKFGTPQGLEIAALKKKQTATWDPMAHGPGTPWEDRATHGLVGAFVKTAVASLTRPRQLADQLRRPETTNDARSFVVGVRPALGHLGRGARGLGPVPQGPPPGATGGRN